MITRVPRSCVAHRAALLDFVDGRRTAETAVALAHLERCRACEDELAGIVRTVAALRRLGRAATAVEPPEESWPRLRERVTRPANALWRWRLSLGGAMMSTAVVALLTLASMRGGSLPVGPAFDAVRPDVTVERRYDPPPGWLTPGIVDAIAGVDVSARARLRSSQFHVAPSSVDRGEHDPATVRLIRGDRQVPPVVMVRS